MLFVSTTIYHILPSKDSPQTKFMENNLSSARFAPLAASLGLQPQELLNKLEERSSKGLFVGFDPTGHEVLEQKGAQHAGFRRSGEDGAPSFMEYEDKGEYSAPTITDP
jgi:hypothetical protein